MSNEAKDRRMRLTVDVNLEQGRILRMAAALKDKSLTEFVTEATMQAAYATLPEMEDALRSFFVAALPKREMTDEEVAIAMTLPPADS